MGSSSYKSTGSEGFSLVELLIVVAVIGTMAMVAVPTTVGIDDARVREAASEVAQALRFARDLSIAEKTGYGVYVDTADERVRVLRFDMGLLPPGPVFDVRHPLSKQLWDIDFDEYGPARGVNVESTQSFLTSCTTTQPVIGFFSGEVVKCLLPETARLDTVVFKLTRGDANATVTIDGLTGRVSLP